MRHRHGLGVVHVIGRHLAQVELEARGHWSRVRLVITLAATVIRLGRGTVATRFNSSRRRRERFRCTALQCGAAGLSSCRRCRQDLLVDGGGVVHAEYRRRELDDVHGRRLLGSFNVPRGDDWMSAPARECAAWRAASRNRGRQAGVTHGTPAAAFESVHTSVSVSRLAQPVRASCPSARSRGTLLARTLPAGTLLAGTLLAGTR